MGDATEVQSLAAVFNTDNHSVTEPWCAVGSVKSQLGHTKAAAGVAGLIKAAMALHHKVLPPSIKVRQPLEIFSQANTPFYLNAEKRPWLKRNRQPRRAGVSAFGFGGSNFHCVLEEAAPAKAQTAWDGDVLLVSFSGENVEQLKQNVNAWASKYNAAAPRTEAYSHTDWEILRVAASQTRASFKHSNFYRVLFVAQREKNNLASLVAQALTLIEKNGDKEFAATPDGVFYGHGISHGKLGMLFPGQGSQYVGMLRDLACTFPELLETLEIANEAYAENATQPRLTDFIYPRFVFDDAARAKQEDALRATEVAQPALGAVSLGALKLLEIFGVKPEAAAGHSYGELTALCAAGRFRCQSLARAFQVARRKDGRQSR